MFLPFPLPLYLDEFMNQERGAWTSGPRTNTNFVIKEGSLPLHLPTPLEWLESRDTNSGMGGGSVALFLAPRRARTPSGCVSHGHKFKH